ncbi:MAG TPA: (d)CMP kinase [Acidimicrobiales bacterium]|nr:(d)CMP kinase [Acidimicrobiales bacterium]
MTVIAIDGPGGSGKSTIARALGARLALPVLDTGAMYRAVTLLARRRGVDPTDGAALAALAAAMEIEVDGLVTLDGEDVSEAIRSAEIDAVVSTVAAHPAVRAELVARQRAWVAGHGGGVVEGRDITSVVLPDADVRVYLTASAEERARRRVDQRGGGEAVGATQAEIAARDAKDSGRTASPLLVADGAVVIDSTGRPVDEIVDEIVALRG